MLKVVVVIAVVVIAVLFISKRNQGGRMFGGKKGGDFDFTPGNITICPYCGARNKAGSVFCGDCGREIASLQPQTATCLTCGAPVEKGSMFCGNCGSEVSFVQETVMTGVEFCNVCGTPVEPGQDYCMNCGAQLKQSSNVRETYDDDDATVLIDADDDQDEACLEYIENGLTRRIHLQNGITKIGSRPTNNDYVLPSKKVSKEHAVIIKEGMRYFIKDLNSTNGTYLNNGNERLETERKIEIHNGEIIRMADIELVLKC